MIMSDNTITIPISLVDRSIELILYGENLGKTIFDVPDAIENGEAKIQIREGCSYEYQMTRGFNLAPSEIIIQSKVNKSAGRIFPNIYVGTLCIDILDLFNTKCGEIQLEVQSIKTTYREDYRHMLEEITEKCTDLLLQHSSPVSQYFEVDFTRESSTLYQRFAFIKSILDSIEFDNALHKIISAPVTRWKENQIIKDVRSVRRFNNAAIRQISSASNRLNIPTDHPLKESLHSIPTKIIVSNKTETVDNAENRFIKHALVTFQAFCSDFNEKLNDNSRIKNESQSLIDKLEQFLSQSMFKEISSPTTLPLNSPVLQRKEGYREILRVWLMFDLAAKMIWHGGDDVYSGNKRDVAVLYEYWLFFKLLDIIKEVFKVDTLSIENLIEETKDGLGLKLKQGKYFPVKGVYNAGQRKLSIEFSYNRTFSGDNKYPGGGSWTRNLRPDYTLSIWPYGIEQEQAEMEELIVHIHFDAKYKVENLQTIFGKEENLDEEEEEQKRGTYKRVDLLKMHTYKDAIRRTEGAYVLYPGNDDKYTRKGFHEIIPGLGAFAIRPSKLNDGTFQMKKFLNEVVTHFMNRASQREKMSFKAYETYRTHSPTELIEALPEAFGINRSLIPDETYVLVGFYKDSQHLDWVYQSGLYNARTGDDRGSVRLGTGESGARYLLLHSYGETITSKLLKITESGPRIFSKDMLLKNNYPSFPSQPFYLIYRVEEVKDAEFMHLKWDLKKLEGYKSGRESALPFSVTLTQLMNAIVH